MTEKELLKKSGFYTSFILFFVSLFWFLFSIQTSFGGYTGGPASGIDTGINSRATTQSNWQVGSSGVFVLRLGIENVTGSGSSGYMAGTNTYYPRIEWTPTLGTFNFVGTGSYPVAVQVNGAGIPSAGSVSGKINAVGGTGTTNTLTDTTLAGQGTITASFGANGLVITPAEYSSVNNATGELQSQITTATGSITNHTHTGSDGTTQIAHNNVTGTGTNSHAILDNFVASKGQASGVASLDANSLVVQNPASGTSTPGASKTVMSDGTGKILDGWLSNNVTKLGTPTTDNIAEGSTNKYHTDARVNATIGSSSITSPQVSPRITFTSPAAGQFLKIVDAQGNVENGTSSVSVDFSAVIGSASASQLPLVSGLLGSATSVQLPTVLKLYGTTTTQSAGAFGQLYVQNSSGFLSRDVTGFGTLTTTSLVSYYRLADLVDDFGANDLTNYGTTSFVAGKYGNCATFNGTTQYLQTGVLSTATTNISMFGWVYFASASEVGGFFNNGVDGADTNGYALGVGNTNMTSAGNNLVAHIHAVVDLNFATAIGTGWHHVGMTRDATTWRGYIDKVQCATTFTNNPTAPSGNFTIGRNYNGANRYYNDKIDDVVFYNKCLSAGEIIELYNNTGTGNEQYTQYSAKYKDPANGNTILEILTFGTVSTKASYIYNNATTTVWGLGTNTAITGTTSGAYAGWSDRPIRVLAVDIGSSKEIKENIKTIKIKPDLLDAEGMAKQNYKLEQKSSWMTDNLVNYKVVVNEAGTVSVTTVDTVTAESDYNNYIELAWAADLNQDTYTENIQKAYEKGFWQMYNSVTPKSWNPIVNPLSTYEGFIVEEMPDVVKGDDGQSINIMSVVAYMAVVQQTLKADTIFALSTLKELITTGTVTQQKIDYCNDRLDVLNP